MVLPGKGMSWKEFFKSLKDEWGRDNVGNVAGALTFQGILALFPFLLFLVSLAGVLIDPHQAQQLIQEMSKVAPQEVTKILGERLEALASSNPVGLLTIGGVGAVWAASGGVVALMEALNTVYGVEEKRPFWKKRGIALLTTLGTALTVVLAAIVAIVTPAIANKLGEPLSGILLWLRMPVAGLLMMCLLAVLYYVLPDVKQKFKFITPGSIVAVLIWVAASWAFSMYVANFGSYDVNYGAIGGVIVMLLWMWISCQVILLGAEINGILEHKSPDGKSPGQRDPDAPGPNVTKTEAEEQGANLPGATDFRPIPPQPGYEARPVPLSKTPLAAAAKWAAGVGLGVFLMRRKSSAR
ncbi:YihY/virulence factor BrkB family protein [Corallococcus carmarthensis]|uniref:YihY/virulence factor BrkB family protein n=1 Tax=Corallococcus carmarthensis TaxID=2316728 RepID=A0A3A8K7W7_9BACT|nr:YihY/virulence factor BrkB family protein [Corallococcus carmarthensis]NOK16244.1 YihY/virulence factor BrkB family protein [Corallococcus carmarthensis]RKH04288.1 YihY/virulence factor BrkB family protein [Corallococcus carmarthensis]